MPWRLFAVAWLYEAGSWFGFLAVVSWLQATGGPAWAGAYFVLYNGVQLPAAALLGPWLDRLAREKGLRLAAALPLLALALALAFRTLASGLLLGGAFAVADYLFYTLLPAAVPIAVPKGGVARANALWQTGSGVLFVLAPAAAGFWIEGAGVFAGFLAAGLFAGLALLFALGLRLGRPGGPGAASGWRAALAHPLVLWTAASVFLLAAGGGVVNAVLPVLTGGGRDYGLLLSAIGLGGLMASLWLLRFPPARPLGLAALGLGFHVLADLGLALGPGLGAYLAAGLLKGGANTAYPVGLDTALQTGLPAAVLARAFSLGWAVGNLGQLLGAGAFSLSAGRLSTQGFFLFSAGLSLLALGPLFAAGRIQGAAVGEGRRA